MDKGKRKARLAGKMDRIRGPLEIGLEYMLLAQALMERLGHDVQQFEAVSDGTIMLSLGCKRCDRSSEISRMDIDGASYMVLTLPSATCAGPAISEGANDAPNGDQDAPQE